MRRKQGTGLTRNEQKVLAAALRLRFDGGRSLYGYELFATLTGWEGAEPMNHGTLYRCMRSLERRGLLVAEEEATGERIRVCYALTADGLAAARRATIQLAALDDPPRWIDVGLAVLVPPEGP